MEELIEKLKKSLLRENDIRLDIPKENFIEILDGKLSIIAFIDGGSAEIFNTVNMSFGIIRTSFVIFERNKRKHSQIFDFYFLTQSKGKGMEIYYNAEIFPNEKNKDFEIAHSLNFYSLDKTIAKNHRAEISTVPDILRRLIEIKTAHHVLKNFNVDVVILDGNLEIETEKEKEYFNLLYNEINEKNIIAALSKTSHVFTKDGSLFSSILRNNGPKNKWYCKAEVDLENIDTYFTKLHENSKHIFKVEIFNKNAKEINNLFSTLASNSKDAVFLGYPYGLIEADRLARISNKELLYLKNLFTAKLGRIDFDKYLSSSNAHEILDRISF